MFISHKTGHQFDDTVGWKVKGWHAWDDTFWVGTQRDTTKPTNVSYV